ncbi:MAG: hypothetical protein AAF601_14910 [Pseudomonadota bacterium]
MILAGVTLAGLLTGLFLPLRTGVIGFLAVAAVLFLSMAGINTARGFEGTSLEESLLLFNNSWVAYAGFNLQITFRAFALPLLALASPLIYRLSRGEA